MNKKNKKNVILFVYLHLMMKPSVPVLSFRRDGCLHFFFFSSIVYFKNKHFFLDFFLHKAYVCMLVYVVCAFEKLHKSKRCSPQLDEELYNGKRIYNAQKYQLFYDAFFLILFCYFFKHFLYVLSAF